MNKRFLVFILAAGCALPMFAAALNFVPSQQQLLPPPANVSPNYGHNVDFQSDAQPVFVPLPERGASGSADSGVSGSGPGGAGGETDKSLLNLSSTQKAAALWVILAAIVLGLLWWLMRDNDDGQK